jgi:hypothetical protein
MDPESTADRETHVSGEAHPRRWAVLGVMCLSLLLVVMDNTIVNVAIPTLQRTLEASDSQLQWIVDAYILVFAGFLLSAGALGDRLGRRGALVGLSRLGDVGEPHGADHRSRDDGLGGGVHHAGHTVDHHQRFH